MARNNVTLYEPIEPQFSSTPLVAAGVVESIKRGEPTKAVTPGTVAIMIDGDGTATQRFAGIAKSDSTDTVATAGSVSVWLPLPGVIYAAKAKTASLANTQALIDGLYNKRVVFDLTGTTWSVDTATADAATNGLVILGGEFQTSTIYFAISTSCTVFE